jgi:hypothetical protein
MARKKEQKKVELSTTPEPTTTVEPTTQSPVIKKINKPIIVNIKPVDRKKTSKLNFNVIKHNKKFY